MVSLLLQSKGKGEKKWNGMFTFEYLHIFFRDVFYKKKFDFFI